MPQHWIPEDATLTRVTMIIFVALLLIMPAQAQPLPYPRLCAEWELLHTEERSRQSRDPEGRRVSFGLGTIWFCLSEDALIRNFR